MARSWTFLRTGTTHTGQEPLHQRHQPAHTGLCLHRFVTTAEKYVHRLMIQTVRMSDAGEYSVVAGSSVSKAHLMVEGRDIRITEPADRDITVRES